MSRPDGSSIAVLASQIDLLRERFGSAARIAAMRGGEWSAVYAVETADAELVARFVCV